MLLREFVEKSRCRFIKNVDGWEDSIRQSCKSLEVDGAVTGEYADEIIACVKKYGPYIVITPGIALPHAMHNSNNAKESAISFMKVEQPVSFDDDNPDKNATLFFTLAARDTDEHLENMRRLFKMLTNEKLCDDLQNVSSEADLLLLADKYNIT